MNKGVELSGIITRLQSQLTHERQSTTASSKITGIYVHKTQCQLVRNNSSRVLVDSG